MSYWPESDPLDDAELVAIEARTRAATVGPWFVVQLDDDYASSLVAVSTTEMPFARWPDFDPGYIVAATLVQAPCRYASSEDGLWDENAEFIAHAREDVPRLIAEVRRLRALVQEDVPGSSRAGAVPDATVNRVDGGCDGY